MLYELLNSGHGDLSCSDNYRGITISAVISNVFELCLLCKVGHLLSSHELQSGFKKNIGCAPGLILMQMYLVSSHLETVSCTLLLWMPVKHSTA